jgi:mannose-6-phosphate isomerase
MNRAPLSFEPLFMERVWGGRRLAARFGKALPEGAVIGESWELVDRPEAQSVVSTGEFAGATLGELWRSAQREALFGAEALAAGDRFPLLIKLLDCEQTLSVQVHPPAQVAPALGGEPKTEMWIIVDATADAHLFTGLRAGVTRERFEAALNAGEDVSEMLHRHDVQTGDVMFLPSGRVHAIGAGNVILEVQQNSDTTYRVFDFNRPGLDGRPRELHVSESLESIDWDDAEPPLVIADGETLVHNEVFEVDRLTVSHPVPGAPAGRCGALMAVDGAVHCGGQRFSAGQLFLLTADADARELVPAHAAPVTVLRAMLPTAPASVATAPAALAPPAG